MLDNSMENQYEPQRLLSYVVASDNGLAPNITGGICTLSVCKPVVRQVSKVGEDYIVGMSTAADGRQKVIYAMQVDEKIPYEQYFDDTRFQAKKPDRSFKGDNFFALINGELQIAFANAAHAEKPQKIARDLKSPFAVVGHRFWYFGSNAPELPVDLQHTPISLPDRSRRGHRVTSNTDHVKAFSEWVNSWSSGIHGHPRDLDQAALVNNPL